jgi:hypothetical protein
MRTATEYYLKIEGLKISSGAVDFWYLYKKTKNLGKTLTIY